MIRWVPPAQGERMFTDKPSIVLATAPRYSRRKKTANSALTGPTIVMPQEATQFAERDTPSASHAAHRPGAKPEIETLSVGEHPQVSAGRAGGGHALFERAAGSMFTDLAEGGDSISRWVVMIVFHRREIW